MKLFKLLALSTMLFGALGMAACNKKGGGGGGGGTVEVTGVSLNKTTLNITVDESSTLVATVSPADATDKTVTWTSSDTSVASVAGGVVKGLKVGDSTITAKAGNFTATCAVKVSEKAPAGQVTVYLNLGAIGLYEGQPGQEYPEKFLENAIKLVAAPGTDLPGADKITSTSGATFSNWMLYEGGGAPTRYDKVPDFDCILLANFVGGSGTDPVDPPTPGEGYTYTCTSLPDWITNDGCVIFAWAWEAGQNGAWYSCTYGDGEKPTELSFHVDGELEGFLLARCKAGTTTPDWSIKDDSVGRVYNQTENIDCTSGVYSYTCSSWKEYK